VENFSGPLYGFDISHTQIATKKVAHITEECDWNAQILDWLRRQEKANGPPTCVALVLDAVQTKNLHVERGVQLSSRPVASSSTATATASNHGSDAPTEETYSDPDCGTRVRWPAMYIRSTLHLGSSLLLSHPRSTASSHGGSSTRLSGTSQPNLLPGWGSMSGSMSHINSVANNSKHSITAATSSNSPHAPAQRKNTMQGILEYGPDVGTAISWPHVEWEQLAGLLNPQEATRSSLVYQPTRDDVSDGLSAISYRDRQEDPKGWSARESIEEAASIFRYEKQSAHAISQVFHLSHCRCETQLPAYRRMHHLLLYLLDSRRKRNLQACFTLPLLVRHSA